MSVHSAPCLNCAYCTKGLFNLCENLMSSKVLGAFSEYILIPRHVVSQNVFKKPDSLGFQEAAFLEPLSCVVHSVEPLNITNKDTVLIIGAGPIGLLHLMLLKHKGAKVMITGLEEGTGSRLPKNWGLMLYFILRKQQPRCVTSPTAWEWIMSLNAQDSLLYGSLRWIMSEGAALLFCLAAAKRTRTLPSAPKGSIMTR